MYGVKWVEWGKDGRMVHKQKEFTTQDKLNKFADKVAEKDNFKEFTAFLNEEER